MTFDIHVSHDFGPYPVIILIVYGPIILYYMYKIEVPVFLLVFFALGLFIIIIYFCYNPYTWKIGFIIENAPTEIVSILMPPEEETPSIDEKGQKLLMFFFVLRLIKFFMS